jgi:outer membrane immunogenic protein
MRRIGALFFMTLGMAGAAQAADLPARLPPVVKAPVMVEAPYNWTGFYIGAHGGGVWDKEEATTVGATLLAPNGTTSSAKKTGFLGGGQIGANYQFNSIVIGVEGDGSWTNEKTASTLTNPTILVPGVTVAGSSKTDWYATATARLGVVVGPALFYAKGGGAWESIAYSATITGAAIPGSPVSGTTSSNTVTGWTAGAGIEYGFAPNWSAKVEYDYMDFGRKRYSTAFGGALGTGLSDIRSTVSVVKAGINYHFNWGGPVTARY